ncbi:MAG: SemiSWEET transporter [Deltaproteobacteria bacterium]|nr:SemiSWEET transporter [Deltaproteobacteria bacterium]
MNSITALGVIAGIITTASFLPQVIKTWKTRHTKDISIYMFLLLVFGMLLWLLYGIVKADIPLILANAVTIGLASIILFFKIKHG